MGITRLLIVEDSRSINRYLSEYLRELGIYVHSAFSLAEAKRAFESESFDYAIFDLTLPDGDAKELISQEIRSAKVIILTSNENQLIRDDYFKLGVLDYISKNNPMDYICKQVEQLIQKIKQNHNYTILIVDDSRAMREICKEVFEIRNYRVVLASSGEEAMGIIQNSTIDLVILDLFLPDMSGLDILYQIRKDSNNLSLPVIALSSTLNNEHIAKVLKHGANDFINKPFSVEQIALRVANLIKDAHTERELEKKLLEVEMLKKQLDDAQKISKMASFEEDIDTGGFRWSAGVYGLLGYDVDGSANGMDFFLKHVLEPRRSELLNSYRTLLSRKVSQESEEFEAITKDGRRLWFSVTLNVIFNNAGNPSKIQGAFLDITETKILRDELMKFNLQLEERIAREIEERSLKERQFRRLFENSYDAIAIVDYHKKKIVDCNETTLRLLGYSKDELRKVSPYRFFSEVSEEKRQTIISGILGHHCEVHDFALRAKSGEVFVGQINFNGVADSDSNLIICSFRNLTEQHNLEVERAHQQSLLIQQSKLAAMGEMIGSIAHQWRQPINALAVKIQDIELAYETGDMNREYITQFIATSMDIISFMSHTIDDFRNFFRPSKATTRFRVMEELQKCIAMVQNKARRSKIKFLVDSRVSDDFMIIGYQNELKQVWLNLLKNAIDAIEERIETEPECDRNINFSIVSKDDVLEMIVSDSGCGIRSDVLEKIFDPYFTTKEQGRGTGIGLYMSKIIIEKSMEGRISVENRPLPERGAVFTIVVPVELKRDTGVELGEWR
ncbi:MAG: response regulator [Wolinella sp.]